MNHTPMYCPACHATVLTAPGLPDQPLPCPHCGHSLVPPTYAVHDPPLASPSPRFHPETKTPQRTSGFAIASLCCGIAALITCITFLPGILALIFGIIALVAIRNSRAPGRGLAIAGITTGTVSFLMGIVVISLFHSTPDISPIPGRELTSNSRHTLESMGVIKPDENIVLFYSDGMFSIEETGVVLTPERLVLYGQNRQIETAPLANVAKINYDPGIGFFGYGQFVITTDDDLCLFFDVNASEHGDFTFFQILCEHISDARKHAQKPPAEFLQNTSSTGNSP